MVEVTYFTCTLGEASLLQKNREIKNINDFIEKQAIRVGNLPAVGFYSVPNSDEKSWKGQVLTFSDIHKGTCVVADIISRNVVLQKYQTVALLCPSNAEFLFLWLALMWLGHPVLLLAPQCSPSAIAHLCNTCSVHQLLYDGMYEELSLKSSKEISGSRETSLSCISIQSLFTQNIYEIIQQEPKSIYSAEQVSNQDVAYLHHTSGTSSGVPKPIPQTHRAGIGVLPTLHGKDQATFTTTPLYHGGIADLFRAWTSDAMIWLFPGKGVPITPTNIIQCLNVAQDSHQTKQTPEVKYFSSVPYVLQMMAADKTGLAKLQGMAIVGVGGAALPVEIGNNLVEQNVNLISRFGSAECGFLMSSHRDYTKDNDWQYLRPADEVNTISFEQRADDLSELIVLSGWPHMAKTNREDGAYATADLFEPHPSIKNAWKYHSRADSQLTLITGKKFDPAPLEASIATSKVLKDVLIFGNGKPYPGALLFRSEEARDMSDDNLIAELVPMISKSNIESQSHVRLARNMLVPMPFLDDALEKSSKGTILRAKAEERYDAEIQQAYSKVSMNNGKYVEDDKISSTIRQIVASVVGRDDGLNEDMDLYSYGIDSVASVQIRHALTQLLPEEKRSSLPLTFVEDCGTVGRLSDLIISRRHGKDHVDEDESQHQLMLSLVKKYSNFSLQPKFGDQNASSPMFDGNQKLQGEVVLLTGATGALGAHILHLYLNCRDVTQIFVLVRGTSEHVATERVSKALSSRRLGPLNPKVKVLRADLSSPLLGLDESTYKTLASMVTMIHHVAWTVNFRLSVSSFSSNLASVQNLINFALSSPQKEPPNYIFCSSVASITNSPTDQIIPESISNNINDCGPLGYSKSKWIAESICDAAHQTTKLKGRIAVMRVGQLSGATDTGIWNMREAYPMMLSQVSLTNILPDLKDVPLTWLPVDIAAKSFLEVAENIKQDEKTNLRVYHVVNANETSQWKDLLGWVKEFRPNLEILPARTFVEKLEDLQKNGADHPAMRLIPHWKAAYGEVGEVYGEHKREEVIEHKQGLRFEMKDTFAVSPILKDVHPVDEVYFDKIWKWVQEQEREVVNGNGMVADKTNR